MQSKRLVGDDEDRGGAPPTVLGHEARERLVNLVLGARVDGEGVDPASKPLSYLLVPVLREMVGKVFQKLSRSVCYESSHTLTRLEGVTTMALSMTGEAGYMQVSSGCICGESERERGRESEKKEKERERVQCNICMHIHLHVFKVSHH